jgi:hypothetical protein
MTRRVARPGYAGVAAALVFVPIVADLLFSDRRRVFGYLAADAFYYLTVGRNLAEHGVLAFDQTHPTNGYHPLWQLTVAGVFVVARRLGLGDPTVLGAVVLLGAALVAAALLLLARAMKVGNHATALGLLTLPVGAYAVATSPLWMLPGARRDPFEGDFPLFGTLWNDANGMETGLLLLAVALASRLFVDAPLSSTGRAALFGAALAAATLSRLDHVFFSLAFLAILAPSLADAMVRRRFSIALLAFAAPIAVYLTLNHVLVGTAFPVSGSLKSTFPHPVNRNLEQTVQLLRGPRDFALAVRQTQMILPFLAATLFLLTRLAGRLRGVSSAAPFTRLLDGLAIGTLLLASYGYWFVRPLHQWHWYYPVSTLFVGLLAACAIDRVLPATSRIARPLAVTIAVATICVFVGTHRQLDYHRFYADFYFDEGPLLRAHYAGREPRIVEFDDGIVAFTTRFPAMSGLGLNLDPEAAAAYRTKSLLPVALGRGFDRITALVYARDLVTDRLGRGDPGALRDYAEVILRRDVKDYDVSLDYHSEQSRFAIVRLTPVNSASR